MASDSSSFRKMGFNQVSLSMFGVSGRLGVPLAAASRDRCCVNFAVRPDHPRLQCTNPSCMGFVV